MPSSAQGLRSALSTLCRLSSSRQPGLAGIVAAAQHTHAGSFGCTSSTQHNFQAPGEPLTPEQQQQHKAQWHPGAAQSDPAAALLYVSALRSTQHQQIVHQAHSSRQYSTVVKAEQLEADKPAGSSAGEGSSSSAGKRSSSSRHHRKSRLAAVTQRMQALDSNSTTSSTSSSSSVSQAGTVSPEPAAQSLSPGSTVSSSTSSSPPQLPVFPTPSDIDNSDAAVAARAAAADGQQAAVAAAAARQQQQRPTQLSSMLAAATEYLETLQPLQAVAHPLQALRDSSVEGHKTYWLPPVAVDEQQQRMLAKATAVIEKLRDKGYSALIAGGWVRDVYLGRPASDVDIATSAPPSRVRSIFAGDTMVDLPRSTVKLSHQGETFELSFFKGISRASNLFSVGMDAVCRDFTVNALYYDPATNEVLDFVGGVADTQARTLRLTKDDVRRLTEDPLRVLRGVRFAIVLGLKLAPGTAHAMRQYAHMCSLNTGVPPRRIWLELRKLAKAEAQQPGSWPKALKLSFHLGLLPHLFPWLTQQQASGSSSGNSSAAVQPQVIDVFGHGVSQPVSSSSNGSSSGSNNSSSTPGKAVVVAERLSRLWQEQQQQQSGNNMESIPMPLLVAATVHPSRDSYAQAEPYLRQLFPDAREWDSIQTLISAAQLLTGSSSSSNGSNGGSAAGGVREGAAESASDWPELYSHHHAGVILSVLSCWMPEALAAGFLRTHRARLAASSTGK